MNRLSQLHFIILCLVLLVGIPSLGYLMFPGHEGLAVGIGLGIGALLSFFLFGLYMSGLEVEKAEIGRKEEKKRAEDALKEDPTNVIAIIQLNMAKLDEYYALNKSQARNSFMASLAAVCVGFGVILLSIRFSGQVPGDKSKLIAGAVSGVLLQFIGGAFFVMYNKSLDQLNLFYGKLVRLQDTMLAVQQCGLLQKNNIDRVREEIISELITRHSQETTSPRGARQPRERRDARNRDVAPEVDQKADQARRKAAVGGTP